MRCCGFLYDEGARLEFCELQVLLLDCIKSRSLLLNRPVVKNCCNETSAERLVTLAVYPLLEHNDCIYFWRFFAKTVNSSTKLYRNKNNQDDFCFKKASIEYITKCSDSPRILKNVSVMARVAMFFDFSSKRFTDVQICIVVKLFSEKFATKKFSLKTSLFESVWLKLQKIKMSSTASLSACLF